jgi:hypothetical protein
MKDIDLYDLYTRKCELESLKEDLEGAEDVMAAIDADPRASSGDRDDAKRDLESALECFGEDEAQELEAIEDLEGQIGELTRHSGTLIHEDNFEDHARELAESTGAIGRNPGWPLHCIDWGQAAEELRMDYTEVTYDGVTYLHQE